MIRFIRATGAGPAAPACRRPARPSGGRGTLALAAIALLAAALSWGSGGCSGGGSEGGVNSRGTASSRSAHEDTARPSQESTISPAGAVGLPDPARPAPSSDSRAPAGPGAERPANRTDRSSAHADPSVYPTAAGPAPAVQGEHPRGHGAETIPVALMGRNLGTSALVHSPGYTPPHDPEVQSELTGKRDVPLNNLTFEGGENSAEALAAYVLDGLRTEDKEVLKSLRVTPSEFADILWPEFPQSRPITSLKAMDAYFFLDRTSLAGMNQGLGDFGGQDLRLDRITYDVGVARYTNFNLYHGVGIHARTHEGREVLLKFVDSFAECRGKWKVYMYKD